MFVATVDLARRAEIGRRKSAKTREQLLGAARSLYAKQAVISVTAEDIVREAGVAKGTLYIHFKSLEAVQMAVADEVTQTFVDLLRPRRARFLDPVERIADGCFTFMHQAIVNRMWGSLVARYAWSFPSVGIGARNLLADDLRHAIRRGLISGISLDLGTAIVVGTVLQVMQSAGEGNFGEFDVPIAVMAILRSLGVSRPEATCAMKRIGKEAR